MTEGQVVDVRVPSLEVKCSFNVPLLWIHLNCVYSRFLLQPQKQSEGVEFYLKFPKVTINDTEYLDEQCVFTRVAKSGAQTSL